MSDDPRQEPLPFPWPTGSYRVVHEDSVSYVQPIATAEDMERYEAALRNDPEADEVREFYARALYYRHRKPEAVIQARILAERSEPGSHHHFTLAAWLRETGDLEGSLAIFEEIRRHATWEEGDEQEQALFH